MDSNVSRWVAFLFGPLTVLAGGFVAVKAKSWFGYDLDPAEAAAYFATIVGGIAAGVVAWVRNRGKYEIAERLDVDPDKLDLITNAVISRLPDAPDGAAKFSKGVSSSGGTSSGQ